MTQTTNGWKSVAFEARLLVIDRTGGGEGCASPDQAVGDGTGITPPMLRSRSRTRRRRRKRSWGSR